MTKKIRVLHITQAVGGGVERYLQMLFKYMDKDKFENILICSNKQDLDAYVELVDEIEQTEMSRSIGVHDIKAVICVRKLIKKYHPDVLYAHSSKAGAIARIGNIGLGKKCIYNPHGWAFNMQGSKKKQAMYVIIERILAHLCDKIVCISDAEKESALKNKICKENKLQVIYNGIDIEKYEKNPVWESRRALNIPDDAFVVGMVGRVSTQKAPDVFIRAAKEIKKEIPNAFFVIVGSGELEEEIQVYAQDNNLDDALLITGWVDEPMKYIKQFDVAVLLSRWEGFGLVLAEYMYAKKPIVATNVDAIPNLIAHGENGLLVEVENYEATAEAVIRFYKDRALADRLSKNGYRRVLERYDVRRVAEEHEKMMIKCI